jgi:hypothetical protein
LFFLKKSNILFDTFSARAAISMVPVPQTRRVQIKLPPIAFFKGRASLLIWIAFIHTIIRVYIHGEAQSRSMICTGSPLKNEEKSENG